MADIELGAEFSGSGDLGGGINKARTLGGFNFINSGSTVIVSGGDRVLHNALTGVQIILNDTDVTNQLLQYHREQSLCTGIGVANFSFVDNFTPSLWDEIILYEYYNKKATYIVYNINRDKITNTLTIDCIDYSKKLSDYLITESYDTSESAYNDTTARYWIQKFLIDVGVEYDFQVLTDGAPISNYTKIGLQVAYDQIVSLLQMSGWFMYFDPDGVCIITSLATKKKYSGQDFKITDRNVLRVNKKKKDDQLRNKVVVWGNSNPLYPPIRLSLFRRTPWQIDASDWRTVVLSNPYIYYQSEANKIAKDILDNFYQIIPEKTVGYANDPGISIAKVVKVQSSQYNGRGLVIVDEADCNSDGLVHNIILDQRCPRLFAYLGMPPEPPALQPVAWLTSTNVVNFPGLVADDELVLRSYPIVGTILSVELF
jgi:hypothetical protein